MFGLGGLLFARDYIHASQSQHKTYILAQGNNKQDEPSFVESNESYKLRYGRQLIDNIAVKELSRNSRAFPNPNPCMRENCISTPGGLIENSVEPNEFWSQIHKELGHDHNISRALKAQPEIPFPPTSCSASSSLPLTQPNNTEYHKKIQSLRHQGTRSKGNGPLSNAQLSPARQISPLPLIVKDRGRAPSHAAQSLSRVRRLSPLRESSGNVARSVEAEEHTLVVQKTRKSIQPLLHTSEPSDRLFKSKVPDRAVKSSLTCTSSFSEDYTKTPTFVARNRAFSSPELCGSLYQSQLVSRTTSVCSLRHLPPDKGRALYIGVNAHIFLPQRQHHTSYETVKYLQSPRKERRIPALTPYAILPPHKFDVFGIMSHTKLAHAGPTPASNSTGKRKRNSSDVSNVGSDYSDYSHMTMVEHVEISESSIMDPAAAKRCGRVFDDITLAMLQREEAQREGFPANMESMMSVFQALFCNPTDEVQHLPQAEQAGVYITSSDALSTLEVVTVNSETDFHGEAVKAKAGKQVDFMSDVQVSSTPTGNYSTTNSESLDQEKFWAKLRKLFTGCFSTR